MLTVGGYSTQNITAYKSNLVYYNIMSSVKGFSGQDDIFLFFFCLSPAVFPPPGGIPAPTPPIPGKHRLTNPL